MQVDEIVREAACGVLGRDDVGLEEPLMSGRSAFGCVMVLQAIHTLRSRPAFIAFQPLLPSHTLKQAVCINAAMEMEAGTGSHQWLPKEVQLL
eukprot:1155414-Pelagomonas_calceolata.AAC.6